MYWTGSRAVLDEGRDRSQSVYPINGYELHFRPMLGLVTASLFPGVGLVVINAFIVQVFVRTDPALAAWSQNRSPPSVDRFSPSLFRYRQTTLMCLGVPFAFIVLNVPCGVVVGLRFRYSTASWYPVLKISSDLLFVNYAVNFPQITGQRFLRDLAELCGCRSSSSSLRGATDDVNTLRRPGMPWWSWRWQLPSKVALDVSNHGRYISIYIEINAG